MTRRRLLALGAASLGGLGLGGADTLARRALRVVTCQRALGGLRAPLRVAVLSDLHAPRYTFPLADLHAALAAARPDLVLNLGDVIDEQGHEPLVEELFGGVTAPLGKFAVLGNHEHWHDIDRHALARHYRTAGVELLFNQTRAIRHAGGDVVVAGLADGFVHPPAGELVAGERRACLTLVHCPTGAARLGPRLGPHTLLLSGHTHGGQIAPFGHALLTPAASGRFVRGWYDVEGHLFYVSPGLGNLVVNARVGVSPTLTIVELT